MYNEIVKTRINAVKTRVVFQPSQKLIGIIKKENMHKNAEIIIQ